MVDPLEDRRVGRRGSSRRGLRLRRVRQRDGDDVQFAGFGKFSVASRAARQGVNPRSPGTKINIPARRVPKFTPGAVLKQTVDTPAKKAAAGRKKR